MRIKYITSLSKKVHMKSKHCMTRMICIFKGKHNKKMVKVFVSKLSFANHDSSSFKESRNGCLENCKRKFFDKKYEIKLKSIMKSLLAKTSEMLKTSKISIERHAQNFITKVGNHASTFKKAVGKEYKKFSKKLCKNKSIIMIGAAYSGKTTLLAHESLNLSGPNASSLHDIQRTHGCDEYLLDGSSIFDFSGDLMQNKDAIEKRFATIKNIMRKNHVTQIILVVTADDLINAVNGKDDQPAMQLINQIVSFNRHVELSICISKCDKLLEFNRFVEQQKLNHAEDFMGADQSSQVDSASFSSDLLLDNAFMEFRNEHISLASSENDLLPSQLTLLWLQIDRLKSSLKGLIEQLPHQLKIHGLFLTGARSMQPMLHRRDHHLEVSEENPFFEESKNEAELFVKGMWKRILIHQEGFYASHFYLKKVPLLSYLLSIASKSKKKMVRKALADPSSFKKTSLVKCLIATIISLVVSLYVGYDWHLKHAAINSIKSTTSVNSERLLKNNNFQISQFLDPHPQLESHWHVFSFSKKENEYKNKLIIKNNNMVLKYNLIPYLDRVATKNLEKSLLQVKALRGDADFIDHSSMYYDLYDHLKTYLMIYDHASQPADSSLINWSKGLLLASHPALTPHQLMTLDGELIAAFSSRNQPYWSKKNSELINKCRQQFAKISPENMAVVLLSSRYTSATVANNSVDGTLISGKILPHIPAIYFRSAFINFYHVAISKLQDNLLDDNWVADYDSAKLTQLKDRNDFVTLIKARYLQLYLDSWLSYTKSLSKIKITTISDIILSLQDVLNPTSSFSRSIHQAVVNTAPLDNEDEFNQIISSQFTPLYTAYNNLTVAGGASSTGNNSSRQPIQQLLKVLTSIVSINDPQSVYYNFSVQQATDKGAVLAMVMNKSAAFPDPYKNIVQSVVRATWNMSLHHASKYIDQLWGTTIYPKLYSQVLQKYPISTSSNDSLDMASFISYFKTNGILSTFFNFYLQPFVDTSALPWKLKSFYHSKLMISNSALMAFQQSYLISHSFFDTIQKNLPFFEFSVQPIRPNTRRNIHQLELAGYFIRSHTNDPSQNHIQWHGEKKISRILFRRSSRSQHTRLLYKDAGAWSWLRVLNDAKISAVKSKHGVFIARFKDSRGHPHLYQITSSAAVTPFIGGVMSGTTFVKSLMNG